VIQDRLSAALTRAATAALADLGVDDPSPMPTSDLSKPRLKEHGDWASNIALTLASRAKRPPRQLAEAIVSHLDEPALIDRVEVAGPGFINLFLKSAWLHETLQEILTKAERFGLSDEPSGQRVQVEFVSANPTGPLHIGHARNAALGDALANVLDAAGHQVEREYYFNDAGGQMDRFGASVEARYLQLVGREAEVPEDGYHGDYVTAIAQDILTNEGPTLADLPAPRRFERLLHEGSARVLDGIKATLARFGVTFDSYLSEAELARKGEIAAAIERLRVSGHAYEADGAVWFRSTDFGDDKDRVIVRTNGTHTYFGADCAYVIDKFSRGFDHLIYVWGADHHGDVVRVKGAAEALGYDPAHVEILIYQFVAFLRGGEPVKMSKRAGTFVSLDELIDEVGTDAARFTLLSYSNDSPMNFDIEVVKRQTLDNPVYYVQYGHARIASILRRAAEQGVELRPWTRETFDILNGDPELDLIRALSELPEMVALAASARAPHRLAHYAETVAHAFHRFYTECRVVSGDDALTQARLWLSTAAKHVIGTTLRLLGVSAPEAMERLDTPGDARRGDEDDALDA
jgi:arginyl-tRNA synthetase